MSNLIAKTVIELNGCHSEAYPSHHLDSMRGLTNVSFIYLDEADFFPPGQRQDARDVSERYIAKSNPWIVMVSTSNAPDGPFEKIEREPEDTCPYKRMFLDYTYGLDKIYTREEIVLAQKSPSFEREYNLKYLGKVGNVFHTLDIEAAIYAARRKRNDGLEYKSHDWKIKWYGVQHPSLPSSLPNTETEKWKYFMPKVLRSHL